MTAHSTNPPSKPHRHTRDRRVVVVAADSERVIPSTKATVTWAVVDPESGEELTAVRVYLFLGELSGGDD